MTLPFQSDDDKHQADYGDYDRPFGHLFEVILN